MTTVKVHFLPDDVRTTATVGEPLLAVAARAGVQISTGCRMGACCACEVEMTGAEEPILACITTIPPGLDSIEIELPYDPTW